jgi:hypothetical protein
MFSARPVNEWGTILYSTADGTKPVGGMGTAVTPAQNTYGTYAALIAGASMTVDCCELTINVNTVGISTAARDCVVSIGLDPAGGTSYTSLVDLVCGPAHAYSDNGNSGGGGVWFRFPIWIKSGTSIAAAAAVNSATLTAINVFCRVRGAPSAPESIRVGSYIDQFGVTLASSSGTAITQGAASDGAYTQIGTLTRPCWAWEFGYGINDATMSNNLLEVDIALGTNTNKKIVIPNATVHTSSIETVSKPWALEPGIGATGDNVYARAQGNVSVDSANSVAVYGVGG